MLQDAYVSPGPLLTWSWAALGCGALLLAMGLALLFLPALRRRRVWGWMGRLLAAMPFLLGGIGALAFAAYSWREYAYFTTRGATIVHFEGTDTLDFLTRQVIDQVRAPGWAVLAGTAALSLAWIALVVELRGRRPPGATTSAMAA